MKIMLVLFTILLFFFGCDKKETQKTIPAIDTEIIDTTKCVIGGRSTNYINVGKCKYDGQAYFVDRFGRCGNCGEKHIIP